MTSRGFCLSCTVVRNSSWTRAACADATRQATWLRLLLEDLQNGLPTNTPVSILNDNNVLSRFIGILPRCKALAALYQRNSWSESCIQWRLWQANYPRLCGCRLWRRSGWIPGVQQLATSSRFMEEQLLGSLDATTEAEYMASAVSK